MNDDAAVKLIECLLDGPDPRVRAQTLLRGLSDLHRSAQADPQWWRNRGCISHREARRLCAAFQLHAMVQAQRLPDCITGPQEVVRALRALASRAQEELWVVTVDGALRPMSRSRVSLGGRSSCSATPVDVLRIAVVDQAAGLFLAHNHPSGDPRPSAADERFTNQVSRGAKALGITLYDHIVMTSREWTSERTGARGPIEPSNGPRSQVNDSP